MPLNFLVLADLPWVTLASTPKSREVDVDVEHSISPLPRPQDLQLRSDKGRERYIWSCPGIIFDEFSYPSPSRPLTHTRRYLETMADQSIVTSPEVQHQYGTDNKDGGDPERIMSAVETENADLKRDHMYVLKTLVIMSFLNAALSRSITSKCSDIFFGK